MGTAVVFAKDKLDVSWTRWCRRLFKGFNCFWLESLLDPKRFFRNVRGLNSPCRQAPAFYVTQFIFMWWWLWTDVFCSQLNDHNFLYNGILISKGLRGKWRSAWRDEGGGWGRSVFSCEVGKKRLSPLSDLLDDEASDLQLSASVTAHKHFF